MTTVYILTWETITGKRFCKNWTENDAFRTRELIYAKKIFSEVDKSKLSF